MFNRDWERGLATIVDARLASTWVHVSLPGVAGSSPYDFIVDVQPASGAPAFRAEFNERVDVRVPMLRAGEQVPVLFDAGSRKLKFDPASPRLDPHAEERRHAALAHAAPGQTDARAAHGHGAEPVASGYKDLDPELAELMAMEQAERAAGPAAPIASPQARLDQLKQLGELHDGGVLSDAEFAAEKAKILAGR